MKMIPLAKTNRPTSQLGFGVAFPPSVSREQAMRLCDAAFDAGIRHFDVAPMYGDGVAEGWLGAFLAKHGGETTVTTKYGILPTAAHIQLARKVLGPVLRTMRKVPTLKKGLADTAKAMKVSYKAAFTPEQLRVSFEHSLRELRLDRVDLFMMHEAEVVDLNDSRLLDVLRELQGKGLIGGFGVAGDMVRVPDLYRDRYAYCNVLQFNWNPLRPDFRLGDAFRIHFSVFVEAAKELQAEFARDPDTQRRLSLNVDRDLGDMRDLTAIMLKAALLPHPNSLVLFSASNPANILRNVQVAGDAGLEEAARRFLVYSAGLVRVPKRA